MITIDKLKKNFGEKIAVDIEHYEINQGDMLGLVGNNGAGKTTLFRLMLNKPIRYMSLVVIRISMVALHLPDIPGVRLRKTVSVCGKKESV